MKFPDMGGGDSLSIDCLDAKINIILSFQDKCVLTNYLLSLLL